MQRQIISIMMVVSIGFFVGSLSPSSAQTPEANGALLFHGNYCGPGNRGFDKAPVDELDAACRHHDQCYPDRGLPACACNIRLSTEAGAVALSPKTEPDVAILAGIVANGALALPCHP